MIFRISTSISVTTTPIRRSVLLWSDCTSASLSASPCTRTRSFSIWKGRKVGGMEVLARARSDMMEGALPLTDQVAPAPSAPSAMQIRSAALLASLAPKPRAPPPNLSAGPAPLTLWDAAAEKEAPPVAASVCPGVAADAEASQPALVPPAPRPRQASRPLLVRQTMASL